MKISFQFSRIFTLLLFLIIHEARLNAQSNTAQSNSEQSNNFQSITGQPGQDVQLKALDRIQPASWWTGMKNPKLQLMVHGKNISLRKVHLTYPGVLLDSVHQVENPNYLFIDLIIKNNAKPGQIIIKFVKRGDSDVDFHFNLNVRTKAIKAQGITHRDLIYLIMPDRFSNGDKSNDIVQAMREKTLNRDSITYRHGGDIQGIINHLDYLKDLGITAIWLTPEIENDMPKFSYHGYAVTDHYIIDPRFGTNELYRTFVEKAHEMGLKVIKDLVHNHVGLQHWFIRDLPMKSWIHQWPQYTQTSYKEQTVMDPYASKSDRKQMLDGWFVPSMPDLNENNPYVQKFLSQNHIWWIEYAGVDGFRLDTYPYNDPAYMATWAKDLKIEYPAISIFGETLVNSVINQAYFTQGNTVNRGFDTQLPGITDTRVKEGIYEALNGQFGWTTGVNNLYSILADDFVYQNAWRNVIFMDNHDMSRYFSLVGEDLNKYKSGLAMLLTTRGIPQIYYGTEILMKNISNPDGLVRLDFPGGWEGDINNKFKVEGRTERENDAFNFLRKLAKYRLNSSALQSGKLMQYAPDNGVYCYFRYDDAKTVMIVVNSNNTKIEFSTKRFTERTEGFSVAVDVITGARLDINKIEIPSQTTRIFELK